ncbi:MAG: IMP cyclohydrolase [archaeon]
MPNDFSALKRLIYSGRGITVGMTPNKEAFIGYTLTGRSPSSQARELVDDGMARNVIRINVTDPEQLKQGSPALLVYPAIVRYGNTLLASNGVQTELLYSAARAKLKKLRGLDPAVGLEKSMACEILDDAMGESTWRYDKQLGWIDIASYEPDEPNNTPRVSACLIDSLNEKRAAFHIVKKIPSGRHIIIIPVSLRPGKAWTVTTYKGGNETPLDPFEGYPLEAKVESESPNDIADSLWEAIQRGQSPDDNYAVATAVMMNTTRFAIRNRQD